MVGVHNEDVLVLVVVEQEGVLVIIQVINGDALGDKGCMYVWGGEGLMDRG